MNAMNVKTITRPINARRVVMIFAIICRWIAFFRAGAILSKAQRTLPLVEECVVLKAHIRKRAPAQFTCNSGADLHEGASYAHGHIIRRTHMTPRFLALAIIPALTLIPAWVSPVPVAAQTDGMAAVSTHLKSVTSMTASFSQTDRKGKTLNGQLSLKRPGKIRFQYQQGVPILIVADGNALIFVDYQVKQVQRWPIGNTPLNVLLNPNRDLREIARIVPNADPRIVIVEVIDKKRPEYGIISLAFTKNESSPGGLLLQGWSAIDAQKNRTTIRLSNQRFNMAISDQAFKWRDPRPKTPGR
jgi:outer membrane lipoprotein-sorting protein